MRHFLRDDDLDRRQAAVLDLATGSKPIGTAIVRSRARRPSRSSSTSRRLRTQLSSRRESPSSR